jgi:hypothetical protein
MQASQIQRLLGEIPDGARVLDVGGGAAPFPRADHVIDALSFEEAGAGSDGSGPGAAGAARFGPDCWTRWDLCERRAWPFADKTFDFAVCSHVLEDVRDPIWICSELSRVAKAGYIETPSRVLEQSRGVENPRYAGYMHHRWLVSLAGECLEFRHKPHVLHAVNDAVVVDLSPGRRIHPRHAVLSVDWSGSVSAREVLEFNEERIVEELCRFARSARELEDLTVSAGMPLGRRLRRHVYFSRLARGVR